MADRPTYSRWVENYLTAEASKNYDRPPKPAHDAAKILRETKFDDAISVQDFSFEINRASGLSDLPLGFYYGITGAFTKTYCYLRFRDEILPRDPPRDGPLGEPDITWLKCNPDSTPKLPESIHQIGQLCLSPTADAKKAKPSSFIIAVTPTSREVWAIWNPNGPEPEQNDDFLDDSNDDPNSQAYQRKIATRPTSGTFPGFPNSPCTAFRLFPTVEVLCQCNDPERPLASRNWQFIALPPKTTLQFPSYPPPAWDPLSKGGAK